MFILMYSSKSKACYTLSTSLQTLFRKKWVRKPLYSKLQHSVGVFSLSNCPPWSGSISTFNISSELCLDNSATLNILFCAASLFNVTETFFVFKKTVTTQNWISNKIHFSQLQLRQVLLCSLRETGLTATALPTNVMGHHLLFSICCKTPHKQPKWQTYEIFISLTRTREIFLLVVVFCLVLCLAGLLGFFFLCFFWFLPFLWVQLHHNSYQKTRLLLYKILPTLQITFERI